ncbi:MAG: putative lipid II flippase FtsW [Rhodospirillales bacterium]|nr:putative lipid II flippase FtsW [Rhodospirillales bacterium]
MSTVANPSFTRTDTSLISRWWWTIDRLTLTAFVTLIAIGAVMTMTASPAVAERIGLDQFHFVRRQFVFLQLGLIVMFATSLLSPRGIRRTSVIFFLAAIVLMAVTLLMGQDIKGATRWLQIGSFSFQASEFVKPSFAIIAAWMFAERRLDERSPGYAVATVLFVIVVGLLAMQPDVGMIIVVAAIWSIQFFLAGLPLILVVMIAFIFLSGIVSAYFIFDHVQVRIDRFLDPASGENYQVARGLEAFRNGGLFGRGPGEGHVKGVLPDAHADFIFSVAGEEFGLVLCLLLVGLFAFVVLRGFARVLKDNDLFILLAVSGLLVQFGLQAIINMASATSLMPPKGMTLPFISYGGSSTLALAYGMGMVLALTRERPREGGRHD